MSAPPLDAVETHCPYCALQCGVIARTSPTLSVVGNRAFPVNAGALCAKGWNAAAVVDHPERLREPLARDRAGRLVPVGWNYALDRIALGIRDTVRTHGEDAVGILGSGALTNEKAYLLGKFARVAVGTANIDYNGRYCMSSGAAADACAPSGSIAACPSRSRISRAPDVILLAGSNPAETMPPFVRYLETQRARRRRAHRRRSAPLGDGAARDAAPAADAGHRHGARQRPAPRAPARGSRRPGLHRRAHRGLLEGARRGGRLLARARRARHRRPRAAAGRRRRASSARPGAASSSPAAAPEQQSQGVANALVVHQHRAGLRLARHAGQRLRHASPARATARAAASTARRPISSPATDRSPTRRRAATSPASGGCRPTRSRAPASRPTSCSRAAAQTAASAPSS